MALRLQAMGVRGYENGFKPTVHPDRVGWPDRWRKPQMVFVDSMSDLFHKDVPLDFIQQVFATMERNPRHTFQLLTKRSKRMRELAPQLKWSKNVWMGVSVGRGDFLHRIDDLRQVPSAIRFLSCEPLLGPLTLDMTGIGWVIVGGESGPGARPVDPDWVRGIRDQCLKAGVPFFFKQWGGRNKKAAGKLLDGRVWTEMPTAVA
jgi:protein gp37